MASHAKTGTGSPSGAVTPDFIGQHYVDTAAPLIYQAYGLTNTSWSANLADSSINKPVANKSANYTIISSDRGNVINVDATAGAITLTLTAAATLGDGFWCYVRKADSSANAVTIDPDAAETVNGAATFGITTQYDQRLLVCDGTNWFLQIDGGGGGGTSTTFAGLVENLEISTSRAGNAETIALKTAAGTDPSGSDKIRIGFRDSTAGNGSYSVLEVTAATSITISSGSTVGATSAVPFRLWLVGFNDAGTFRLGVIKCALSSGVYGLQDNVLASSTAEGGAGAADSSGVIYTGTAVTTKAMRVLGYLEYTLTTAGTWDTAPSVVQIHGWHERLPGESVQRNRVTDGTFSSGTTTIPLDNTTPQNTEGVAFSSTLSITPKSAINFLEITASINIENSSNNNMTLALFQDSGADAIATMTSNNFLAGGRIIMPIVHQMLAGTTSSTTFSIRGGGSVAGTTRFNSAGGAAVMNGTLASYIMAEEIMV